MTMRGTPFYYYGDELGMDNIKFDKIEDYQDMSVKNAYQHLKQTHGNLAQFIETQKLPRAITAARLFSGTTAPMQVSARAKHG